MMFKKMTYSIYANVALEIENTALMKAFFRSIAEMKWSGLKHSESKERHNFASRVIHPRNVNKC